MQPKLFRLIFNFTLVFMMVLLTNAPSSHANLTEADCRLCHENPDQFPVDPTPIITRHHDVNGTLIPDPTVAPYGVPGELFNCLSCHALDTQAGILKLLVEKDCTVCHGSLSHRDQHDMTMTDLPDCLQCHVNNVLTEHVINRGLLCGVCHDSPWQGIQDAIANGKRGNVVYCSDCHGITSHREQHESANTVCTTCHQSNLQDAHNNNCNLCHESTVPEVQNAIISGNTDCIACHAFTSHEEQHDMTMTDSPDCLQCHVNNVFTEHVTNHGLPCSVCHDSTRLDVQDAITKGKGGEAVYCSDCHVFTSHRTQHETTNTDCTTCHQSNLQDTHNNNCNLCHESTVPEVQNAILSGNTDCIACHSSPAHAESCKVCHTDKSFSDYIGRGQEIHDRHKDKVVCGICHEIPPSVAIGPQNNACATLCHGGRSYTSFQDIHKNHMSRLNNLPNPCYWCHGLSVPQRPNNICLLCHTDKNGGSILAHNIHDTRFDCTACHESVAGFGPDVRFDTTRQVCNFCHSPRGGSAWSIHGEHIDKAQCYICHGDSNVYASFRGEKDCTICHGQWSAGFERIHKAHAGKAMMCTVCHSMVPPNVAGIQGLLTDPDSDGDGILDSQDNCPNNCNVEQLDADGDGTGDVCDSNPGCGGCAGPACELECTL